MDEEQKTTGYQQDDGHFVSVLKELTHIKEAYASKQLQWYREHAPRVRLYFRVSSTLIIIFSVSIPFLATPTLGGIWKTIVLPVVALLIAALTGLSAFFRWESSWKEYIHAQLTLEHALWMWELKIIEAKHEMDPKKGIEIALHATEQLISDTQGTIIAEAEEYFKRVQVPQINKS